MPPVLIDTNVLVYAFDQNDAQRQERAIGVLQQLQLSGAGRLSAQSLAEFFSACTRLLHPPLTDREALDQLERFSQAYRVLDLNAQVVLEAARGVRDHQLGYWDAQVWAMARLNQIQLVLSGDSSAGTTLEGVRFINPFTPDFDLQAWT